ncbi:hypothetical protein D3C85_846210 [compost metagenome]
MARQFHRHLRVGIGGEALAAKLLGDDQGEKAVVLDEGPGLRRQVHGLTELPFTDHGAECFGRPVDESLFLFIQLRFGIGQQFAPVRTATEQFAVPPDRAGVDGIAFGLRHRRQGFLEPVEHRRAEQFAAQVGQQQRRGDGGDQHPENQQQPARCAAESAHGHDIDGHDDQGGQRGDAAVGQISNPDQQNQYPQQQHIHSSVKPGRTSPQSLDGIRETGWLERCDSNRGKPRMIFVRQMGRTRGKYVH